MTLQECWYDVPFPGVAAIWGNQLNVDRHLAHSVEVESVCEGI